MAKRMLGMPARIAGSLPIKKKFLLVFLGAVGLPILLAAVLSLSFFIDISTKNARAMLDDKLKLAELLYKNLTQMLHSTANTLAADNLVRLDLQEAPVQQEPRVRLVRRERLDRTDQPETPAPPERLVKLVRRAPPVKQDQPDQPDPRERQDRLVPLVVPEQLEQPVK